jgi:uncharacterized RDD family membrane protein YckC
MSEFNPYAPPQTDPIADLSSTLDAPLASPWIRLGASLIDGLIVFAMNLPLMYFSGYFARTMEGAQRGQTFFPESFLWSAIGIAIFVAINWTSLQKGQTIGKKLVKIQIVKKDGSPIPATAIILRRLLPVQVVALIPFLGGLLLCVDALLIFRSKRNTLHDDVADTKVIQLQ